MQQMIDGKIIFFRKQFSARIKNIISSNPKFRQAIIHKDNQKIKQIMQNLFKILKKENKYTKTFHLISKNNISIYRAHKPKEFGDDLSNIRPMIVYVNKYKRARYGFETGLYAMVYRVTIPIIYNNIHYCTIEYGVDPNLFIDDLTLVSNFIESAILINKNSFEKMKVDRLKFNAKIINESKKYFLFDNNIFFKNVNLNDIDNNIYFNHKDEHYTAYLYNLLKFNGMSAGKILIALNITADEHRYEEIIKLSVANQIVLIFIIFIIVYYAFNYFEKRIKELTDQDKQNERILQQQAKMASMGEMIGNIAHQWRQPLSVISTIASGILVQKELNIFNEEIVIKQMGEIVHQTKHMSKTIDDFRNFFKQDKKQTKFNLNNVIVRNIALLESNFKNNNIKIIQLNNKDIDIYGLENELIQAILNILNNAKDQLLKLKEDIPKIVKIEIKKETNNAHILITDNGGGIPQDIINKIFEPYFTTKHQSQGTGIGLYMTHEIITKHFGAKLLVSNKTIEYENKTYQGACFKIIFPLS